MYIIENEFLKIEIDPKGAELQSIYNKKRSLEYMWSGDPAYWGKKSPVLFPIVGTLKQDTYYYENKTYHLSRHGFARDMDFTVTDQTPSSITFTLARTDETFEKYPFQFRFDIIYSLKENQLSVMYRVVNKGNVNDAMYFSVGGHPAFKLPVLPGTKYNDHYLEFNKNETAGRWLISKEGLIENHNTPLLNDSNILALTKELFYTDALVFKELRSEKLKLVCKEAGELFEFDFTGFPYLGIWAAKDADFICIEPWCGIADNVNASQQLIEKEGIIKLESADQFERSWKLTIY
ncbi:MAG: aldose 1-epimerase family protein [Chitinophagaceae bacterium]